MTAAFDTEYDDPYGHRATPAWLTTLTIRPAPRRSMEGSTATVALWVPLTLTSTARHHSSGSTSQASPRLPPIPALFTNTSTGPCASVTAATARSRAAVSSTSAMQAMPSTSPATVSTSGRLRPSTATLWPAAANARTVVAPYPRPPPVTRASTLVDATEPAGRMDRAGPCPATIGLEGSGR